MIDIISRLSAGLADRYRIERELGGGGMSRVFLAEELTLGRKVVVKVLPPDLGAGVNVDRFRREIHLAASLQHPHIVPLLAAGSADGLLYYTMPLVEGESLRAKLSREGELPINEVIKLLRDVADALACAHERGVLHRDIKPDNILVSRHHALVADFGVAKALSAASGDASGSTTEGVALGTPAYMAPEQAVADPHTDHRADLYALGVVGYEMLTGNTPFPGLSGQAVLAAHATRPVPPVTEVRPAVPAALANLIMHCLEKHPADRCQSADEVLQQLEALSTPSGGTAPTRAVPARHPAAGRRRTAVVLGGAAVAAAIAAVMLVTKRPGARPTLDPNLLAVAPFDVLGQGLELWREGLMDFLSRNLDGAGPLRTVSPTVVIGRWQGRADPASVSALGHRTAAGLAVFGNLVATGRDSVRLAATIVDVAQDRTLGEMQVRGDVQHMDRLADSLTVGLLGELSRKRDIVAVRTAGLTSTSLPALKSFLEGERLYRRGSYDSAEVAYRRALSHDSTFVPAMRHLAQSLWWRGSADTSYVPYLIRAGELNHRLSQRDSLLVVADCLWIALRGVEDFKPELRRNIARRMFGALEEGARLYPEDPEIWYELGEVRWHMHWLQTPSPRKALEAFDRALALDSSFTPAYVHTPTIAGLVYGRPGWERYAARYLVRNPSDDGASGVRLMAAIFRSDSAEPGKTNSIMRAADPYAIGTALFDAWNFPDSAETAIRLARAFVVAPKHRIPSSFDDPWIRRQILAGVLAFRGHLREAQTILGNRPPGWFSSLPAEIALVRGSRPEEADRVFAQWLREGPLWAGDWWTDGPPGPLFFALPWWASRRDTQALARYAHRADSARHAASRPMHKEIAQYASHAALAYSALARGDTATALRRISALPHDVFWGGLERTTEGQILARRGGDAEALRLFEGAFPWDWKGPVRVLSALEAARAAERLGDRERASVGYQYVLDAWRYADPELQPYVTDARQGLARLTSEPRP